MNMSHVVIEFYGIPRLRTGRPEITVFAATLQEALLALQQEFPHWTDLLTNGRLSPHFRASSNGEFFVTNPCEVLAPGSRLLILSADVGG